MRHLETSYWRLGPFEVQFKHVTRRVIVWRGHRKWTLELHRKRNRRSWY